MVNVVRVNIDGHDALAVVVSEREAWALLQIANFSGSLWKRDAELEDGQIETRDFIEETSNSIWDELQKAMPDADPEDVYKIAKYP